MSEEDDYRQSPLRKYKLAHLSITRETWTREGY